MQMFLAKAVDGSFKLVKSWDEFKVFGLIPTARHPSSFYCFGKDETITLTFLTPEEEISIKNLIAIRDEASNKLDEFIDERHELKISK